MKLHTSVLAVGVAALAATAFGAAGGSARQRVPAALCAKGGVRAVIGGKALCLASGAHCQTRYAKQYRLRGFLCVKGRLERAKAKPAPVSPTGPPPTPIPPVATLPTGPSAAASMLPAPQPMPRGTATISVPGVSTAKGNGTLVGAAGAIWTASGPYRIDPATNSLSGPFTSGGQQDIGADDTGVWVSDYVASQVRRLDPTTGKQLSAVHLPPGAGPEGVVVSSGSVWVATHHAGTVIRIDETTNKIVANISVTSADGNGPQGIAAGLGSVWVDVPNRNVVDRIDPATNRIAATIAFPPAMTPCGGIAVGSTAVWVTGCGVSPYVARIDPATNSIASILSLGGGTSVGVASSGNTLWVVVGPGPDSPAGTQSYLVHVNADDTVSARFMLPQGFTSGGVAVAFGSVWVADFFSPTLIRLPA